MFFSSTIYILYKHFISRVLYQTIINLECTLLYISLPPIQKMPRLLNLLFWCCTRWSLHQRYVTISVSRLLPYFFTLTIFMAVIFCCTFLRITSTRRYLAPCLVVPGLSSHFARSSEILISIIISYVHIFCLEKLLLKGDYLNIVSLRGVFHHYSTLFLSECMFSHF